MANLAQMYKDLEAMAAPRFGRTQVEAIARGRRTPPTKRAECYLYKVETDGTIHVVIHSEKSITKRMATMKMGIWLASTLAQDILDCDECPVAHAQDCPQDCVFAHQWKAEAADRARAVEEAETAAEDREVGIGPVEGGLLAEINALLGDSYPGDNIELADLEGIEERVG